MGDHHPPKPPDVRTQAEIDAAKVVLQRRGGPGTIRERVARVRAAARALRTMRP